MSPNPPLVVDLADVFVGPAGDTQPRLPLHTQGVQRWVWHGRFGSMLIEVSDGQVFVNGQLVQPHVA